MFKNTWQWFIARPKRWLTVLLTVGLLVMVAWEGRSVGFTVWQWVGLVLVTTATAIGAAWLLDSA
jgi:hypothetical protein